MGGGGRTDGIFTSRSIEEAMINSSFQSSDEIRGTGKVRFGREKGEDRVRDLVNERENRRGWRKIDLIE